MNQDERIKMGFDLAFGLVKQVVTLSTGIVAITAAAARFIFVGASEQAMLWMILSWGAFLISIAFGVLGLMALTANMAPKNLNDNTPRPSPYTTGARVTIAIQLVGFAIGLLLVTLFATSAFACNALDQYWFCN